MELPAQHEGEGVRISEHKGDNDDPMDASEPETEHFVPTPSSPASWTLDETYGRLVHIGNFLT